MTSPIGVFKYYCRCLSMRQADIFHVPLFFLAMVSPFDLVRRCHNYYRRPHIQYDPFCLSKEKVSLACTVLDVLVAISNLKTVQVLCSWRQLHYFNVFETSSTRAVQQQLCGSGLSITGLVLVADGNPLDIAIEMCFSSLLFSSYIVFWYDKHCCIHLTIVNLYWLQIVRVKCEVLVCVC